MRKIGRNDPTTPVPGRVWYAGAWRPPEEVEKRREYVRAHRRKIGTKGRAKREAGERMRDRSTPVPGRTFYAGRWRTPEEVERVRERQRIKNRARYVPRVRQTRLSDEERARRAAAKRLKGIESRAAKRASESLSRARAVEAKQRAPVAVRDAWNRAAPGSIIRRKYPTRDALDAGARRGDFDGFR